MKKKLAIIHYQPLEDYPPIQNFLNDIADKKYNIDLLVLTSKSNKWNWAFSLPNGLVVRLPMPTKEQPLIIRMLYYWYFNLSCLLRLIVYRPGVVLYYESTSAWPVWAYSKVFKTNILIHYHEYFTKVQYPKQMWLDRFNHKLEVSSLYNKAKWISHTNKDRLAFFRQDYAIKEDDICLEVFPNYPPSNWIVQNKKNIAYKSLPLRLVYVGSLSLNNTYLQELVKWVEIQNGSVELSVYSYNLDMDTKNFLERIQSPFVEFNIEGLRYSEIPKTLHRYDVGIIFYKPYSKNVVYCAPNKFFEYLACGLDVWFSKELTGLHHFKQTEFAPKVVEVDFRNLGSYDFLSMITEDMKFSSSFYTAENAQKPLIQFICDLLSE